MVEERPSHLREDGSQVGWAEEGLVVPCLAQLLDPRRWRLSEGSTPVTPQPCTNVPSLLPTSHSALSKTSPELRNPSPPLPMASGASSIDAVDVVSHGGLTFRQTVGAPE